MPAILPGGTGLSRPPRRAFHDERALPCPPIEGGSGRIVTETFTHLSDELLSVKLRGCRKPLELIRAHRLYREDRESWQPACELVVGERLRTIHGTTVVQS